MLTNFPQQESTLIDDKIPQNLSIAEEYRLLFACDTLTSQQADRAEEILNLARQDKQLDSLITNVISQESKAQALTSDDCLESYKDQIAALREYQGTNFSGLTNTMFGNVQAATLISTASSENTLKQDIHQLAMALQSDTDCDMNQDQSYSSR